MAAGMNARPICPAFVFLAFILVVVVSRAAARPVANAPSCAVSCLETVARASGCTDTHDQACVCSIHDTILRESKSCIDRSCINETEKVDALAYLNGVCMSEAKPLPAINTTLPSSAPTLPPFADPSPISASTAPSIHESSTPTLSSTTPSSLPAWSAGGSPTVIAGRAAETTAGGKHDDDDDDDDEDDDDDKKESKTYKISKIIGGVIGGIGAGIAAIMGVQSMLSDGGSDDQCCCCGGCCWWLNRRPSL